MSGQQEITLSLSLSELRALITKAARGAGMEWGMAEEAGWAAEWLARRGLPAAEWAADWLAERTRAAAGPVDCGAALADLVRGQGAAVPSLTVPDGLPAPGYLLPFLHLALGPGQCCTLTSPSGPVARIGGGGAVALGPAWQGRTLGWRLTLGGEGPPPTSLASRAPVSALLLECLEALALKTTVPPSASSRKDAGSAAADND